MSRSIARPASASPWTSTWRYWTLHGIVLYAYTLLRMALGLGLSKIWAGREAAGGAGASDTESEGAEMAEMGKKKGNGIGKNRGKDKGKHMDKDKPRHYPGMVNLSGTLCYMNSVLQALASVPSLAHHLDRIYALAENVDEPSMVSDALSDVLLTLNTPSARPPSAIRPNELLMALYEQPAIRRLLGTREQQDAHELFLVLAEAVSNESVRVARAVARSRGLGEVVSLQGYTSRASGSKAKGLAQPWEGLMARRRMCGVCGWSEGVRMDTLGGLELPLPQYGDVSLESCIAQYLAPEQLSDVTCEQCTVRRTLIHYAGEVERLSTEDATSARRKRARDARKVEARVRAVLESGVPSLDVVVPGVKWQTVRTSSVREGMIARAPAVLRLHLVRSEYTPYGTLLKKTARVAFPIVLDMTPFLSRGVWEARAGVMGALDDQGQAPVRRVVYRLVSVILHYGYTHSSGHYVCIRRIPTDSGVDGEGVNSGGSTRKACPDGCVCQDCAYFGQVRELDAVPGKGWLRISDADVEEVGAEELVSARAQVSMLFYERVQEYA